MSLHRELAKKIAAVQPDYGTADFIESLLLEVWPTERALEDKVAEMMVMRGESV